MSWSLQKIAARDEARAAFAASHQEQSAYSQDGAHKEVMDKIVAFAASVAEAAPEGCVVTLNSNGHVSADGHGSCGLSMTFYPAVKA